MLDVAVLSKGPIRLDALFESVRSAGPIQPAKPQELLLPDLWCLPNLLEPPFDREVRRTQFAWFQTR